MKLHKEGEMRLMRPELFYSALDLCIDVYNAEPAPELRFRLANAALLFAQVAEQLARGKALTPEIIERCHSALHLLGDDPVRSEIETLLTRNRKQPQDAPQSRFAAE
jgi:hypothetical protein